MKCFIIIRYNFRIYCKKNSNYIWQNLPKVGQYVLAFNERLDTWERGIIRSTDSKSFHVHLVDYGNEVVVSQEQTRDLPRKFYKLPAQSVCCGVAGVGSTMLLGCSGLRGMRHIFLLK